MKTILAILIIFFYSSAALAEAHRLHGRSLQIAKAVKLPKSLRAACPNIIPWPSRLLFKSESSGHLSHDQRAGGTSIIAGLRCPVTPIRNKVKLFASNGRLVSTATAYLGNDGRTYRWRAYSRWAGGSGESGATINARLRRWTRTTKSYMQLALGRKVVCAILPSAVGRTGGV